MREEQGGHGAVRRPRRLDGAWTRGHARASRRGRSPDRRGGRGVRGSGQGSRRRRRPRPTATRGSEDRGPRRWMVRALDEDHVARGTRRSGARLAPVRSTTRWDARVAGSVESFKLPLPRVSAREPKAVRSLHPHECLRPLSSLPSGSGRGHVERSGSRSPVLSSPRRCLRGRVERLGRRNVSLTNTDIDGGVAFLSLSAGKPMPQGERSALPWAGSSKAGVQPGSGNQGPRRSVEGSNEEISAVTRWT